VLEIQEKVLGREHPDTLTSMNNLALVLDSQGKYEVAERMHREVLEGRKKVLGREHPSTLTSVYCLAFLLQKRGHYTQAVELYERACSGYAKVIGPDHPTTANCRLHYSSLKDEMAIGI
jgi:tetratricopeptide (TPR) repeat protein